MAVKYYIRYFDIIGVEHRLDIYDDTYEDEAIQVDGKVTLTYSDTDDSLEAIRGQGLSVELEANTDLTFNTLWSEDEKTYRVEYFRNFELIFKGWLNPEGFFEDYVNTDWIVTFDCVDGLGYLSDLSFVEDETGFPITGRKSYIEILYLALKRTGFEQDINTSIGIEYTDMDTTKGVLTQVYANTERYIKDDEETYMSCEDVIRDVLEPFGAVLTSLNGQWYIYKPNELFDNTTVTFKGYRYFDGVGILKNAVDKILDTSVVIGNDGVRDLFHCNANQSIRNVSSIGAYRINYKYGFEKSLINNTSLYSDDGISINDFTILSTTYLDPLIAGGSGVVFNPITNTSELIEPSIENIRTNVITIDENAGLNISFSMDGFTKLNNANFYIKYQVIVCDNFIDNINTNKYYLKDDFSWDTLNSENTIEYVNLSFEEVTINVKTPVQPPAIVGTAYFYVKILTPRKIYREDAFVSKINLNEFKISVNPDVGTTSAEGEFHTFQRLTKPSAKIKENKEVATGDNVSDIYLGTIYQRDAVTPTETWNRKGVVETKPLLEIMGEETLRLNAKPSRMFTGDVYGYFNYLSVISIDNLEGVYMPIKYSYDTKNNIISGEFKQIYGDELDDIDYKKTYDYGNTVKPTIK